MILKVISSSSRGNGYILQCNNETLLIECGVPFKQIQKSLDYDLSRVAGAIGTHSHLDHMGYAKDFMNAGIDVFASKETFSTLNLTGHRTQVVDPLKQFNIKGFKILPFESMHDCLGSLGYLIQEGATKLKLLFLTDSFYCKYKFRCVHLLMIECNYIKETLDQNIADGRIPEAMKPRLLQSHFSLENVKKFLKANDLSQCRKIVLLHLSDANSHAKRMVSEIEQLTGIETVVAEKGLELELELYPY